MVRKNAPMLRYVAHYNATYGWFLFPARIDGKVKKSWLQKKDAPEHRNWGMSADPEQLKKNFSDPRVRCIGLPTGKDNKLFVLEIDTKKGHGVDGIVALRALELRYGKLPITLMAKSPSGSLHYYFNHPGIKVWSSASRLGPGIDIRGDGAMVIAPPSERADGVYAWVNEEEIADAPDWLIALVTVSTSGLSHDAHNTADVSFDPYAQLGHAQNKKPLDHDEMLDDMAYGKNVHDIEVRLTASLLAQGEPVDVVIDTVLDEVRVRVEADKLKWDLQAERTKLRGMCATWLLKKPDVLELQQTIPPWLAKRLNGHDPAGAKPSDTKSKDVEIPHIYADELDQEPITPPTWIVQDLILEHAVNGFFGDGATGKDLLMLQLSYAVTHNKTFLGMEVTQGRVIYINTEDSKVHLRWRQSKIMAHMDIQNSNRDLMIVPMWGEEHVLWAKLDRNGHVEATETYHAICKLIEEFKPTLVIVANRVNIFAVNQNDDVQARQCLALLDAIVKKYQCTVIMPAHPSLGQLASGSGSSGSVQWSNGCRQRLYLSRPKKENGNGDDDTLSESDRDKRNLQVLKSNWGPSLTGGINMRWVDWFFEGENEHLMIEQEDGVSAAEAKQRRKATEIEQAEKEFMRMLSLAGMLKFNVSSQNTARTNAATLFARHEQFKECRFRGDAGYKILIEAMKRLFEKGLIRNVPLGYASKGTFQIEAVDIKGFPT